MVIRLNRVSMVLYIHVVTNVVMKILIENLLFIF